MYKIGTNKFMGGGGVCGRGVGVSAFCSVYIFHNHKMHVYLIYQIAKSTSYYTAYSLYVNAPLVSGRENKHHYL